MTDSAASFDQRSFISELDDVAQVLKTTLAGHDGHDGWTLRSTGVLTCGCGQALYAPESEVPSTELRATVQPADHADDSDRGGREVVVHAPAEIDVATADAFGLDLWQSFAAGPDRVVIDFAATTFCDSTALRLLVMAVKQARTSGCGLLLVHPPRQLLLMAEILGASELLGLPPHRP